MHVYFALSHVSPDHIITVKLATARVLRQAMERLGTGRPPAAGSHMLIPPAQVDFADEDEEQVDDAEIEMLQKALRQTIQVSVCTQIKSHAMAG